MPTAQSKYSIDTSSLLAAWVERYPKKHFESFWVRMEGALTSGLVLLSREVFREVGRKDEALFQWLKDAAVDGVEIDAAVVAEVQRIMRSYPKLVDTRTGKSGVDPFVIGLARACAPRLVVVTEESRGGNRERPKIPFVCDQTDVGLDCTNLLGLIQAEDWRF